MLLKQQHMKTEKTLEMVEKEEKQLLFQKLEEINCMKEKLLKKLKSSKYIQQLNHSI